MKLIGFIKEHNNIEGAHELKDYLHDKANFSENFEKIVRYLNSGVILLAWMGYFSDNETGQYISADAYLTDGIWVWPAYYPYYLEKYPYLKIEEEFYEYLKDRNFEFQIDSTFKSMEGYLETELSKKLIEENSANI